jgi:hypothetical protein
MSRGSKREKDKRREELTLAIEGDRLLESIDVATARGAGNDGRVGYAISSLS